MTSVGSGGIGGVGGSIGGGIPSAGLNIHPSRLATSHVLRQSVQKKVNQGVQKEKTKAKQRYLNKKKDRRKKRKVAAIASAPKKKRKDEDGSTIIPQQGDDSVNASEMDVEDEEETSESESSEDDDSDEEEDDDEEGDDTVATKAQSDGKDVEDEQEATALSRFPAPRTVFQASKRDLAAQGLPESLARPEIVDVGQTSTVLKSDRRELDLISQSMRSRLESLGISEWFAVQTAIIPKLLDHPSSYDLYPSPPPGDLCVSAPTGSGKTLSYVVPMVEVLQHRTCKRVRGLILLPTRDLVHQVRETLDAVSKGTGLSIVNLTGQQSFVNEQASLVDANPILLRRNIPGLLNPPSGSEAEKRMMAIRQSILGEKNANKPIESKADIVIATPGRLIDHMDQTPGFTLQHLRFLVIDEADRLLNQSFHEWLPRILNAIDPSQSVSERKKDDLLIGNPAVHSAMHPAWLQASRLQSESTKMSPGVSSILPIQPTNTVQKLLFSATLTRDPAKIIALNLRDASFVSVEDAKKESKGEGEGETEGKEGKHEPEAKDWQDSFSLPATLQEHVMVMPTSEKPLHLLHLLYTREEPLKQVLCFTKSVESAKRLVKFLEFVEEIRNSRQKIKRRTAIESTESLVVKEYSSQLRGAERTQLLTQFKEGLIDILICSDVISRGIDLPDVQNVISYDSPIDMAKYVHRVGRTARAGRKGNAFTLVEEQEARHFTHMMRRAGRWEKIEKIRMTKVWQASVNKAKDIEQKAPIIDQTIVQLSQDYQTALQKLEQQFSNKRAE